jgi:hypothetical protein
MNGTPYPCYKQAALDQAKADVAVAQAKLAEQTTNVVRDTPLAAQNAIPQKQLDTDLANQAAAKAEVLARQASLQNAELNLGWTKVYHWVVPVATACGRVGNIRPPGLIFDMISAFSRAVPYAKWLPWSLCRSRVL